MAPPLLPIYGRYIPAELGFYWLCEKICRYVHLLPARLPALQRYIARSRSVRSLGSV